MRERLLSIIILHHNTPLDVAKLLNSLQLALLPRDTEIVVVNNGGNLANQKIVKKCYDKLEVRFLDIPNRGYSQGNNSGLALTKAKYYAFINPDIIVSKDCLQILIEYLETHKNVGIVAPQLRYPDQTVQDNYRVFPRIHDLIIKRTPFLRRLFPNRMREYLMWDKEPSVNEPADWVTGAFMIVRDVCLKACGNHDERFFLFMSDLAMCRKAWENGYEVYLLGQACSIHNDQRLSSGGFFDVFRKKTLRIHILDALRYYLLFLGKSLPKNSPSLSNITPKARLLRTKKLNTSTFLKAVTKKLQRKNPVVTVYSGQVVGHINYEQPVVFFNTGVVSVIRNRKAEYGLMKIWRHIPLSFNKKNTFPIFPDVGNLGVWSFECVRGGVEKSDITEEDAIKRELREEIGLKKEDIIATKLLGRIVGNTAVDVYNHYCFEVVVRDNFHFVTREKVETIKEFRFYSLKEIDSLIKDHKLFCGITQAALLEAILSSNLNISLDATLTG